MMPARIEPSSAGSILRVFECPKCERVQRVLAEDPIRSHIAWLNSELKPPD
jgi:hypothetical protein